MRIHPENVEADESSLNSHSLLFSGQQPTTTTPPPPPPVEVPDFVEPIGNHTVAVGRDAQLACKINKLGSFRTAWLRVEDKGILTIHNNVITRNYRVGLINNDDEAKNFILTIKNVQPADRGGYMCQINSVPMRYAIGYLDVLTPPVFDDSEENVGRSDSSGGAAGSGQPAGGIVVVNEGASANLSCQASGHPAPEIVWRREDGEPIRLSSQELEVPKVEGASLVLSQVSRLNAGAYLCIASNGVQPAASKRQVLDVRYRPVVRLPQTEVEARLGQPEAQLVCFVDLNPVGSYHWARLADSSSSSRAGLDDDDQALIEHDELINSDKHEIVIKQVNSETVQMILVVRHIEKVDLARYKCIARNSLGIQSSSIRLSEPSTFSLNTMFGGGGGGGSSRTGQSTEPAGSQAPQDQQLNDQQEAPSRNGLAPTPARASQYLSTRANSRSSWIQRASSSSSSSRAAAAAEASAASSLRPPPRWAGAPILLISAILAATSIAQIVVVFVVDAASLAHRRLPIDVAAAGRR